MLTFQTTLRTHFRISTCHYQHCKDTHFVPQLSSLFLGTFTCPLGVTSKVYASSYFQGTVYVTHGNLDTSAHTKNKDLDIHWLSLKIKFMWGNTINLLHYQSTRAYPWWPYTFQNRNEAHSLWVLPCTNALLGFWGAEYLSLVLSLISTFLQASLICWGTNHFYLRLFNPYSQCPTWRKKLFSTDLEVKWQDRFPWALFTLKALDKKDSASSELWQLTDFGGGVSQHSTSVFQDYTIFLASRHYLSAV